MSLSEENKAVVIRFNREVIEKGNRDAFDALMAPDFINHTAMAGISNKSDGMWVVLEALRKGFPGLTVEIHDQIAEGDKVCTRKKILGTHTSEFMGIAPTNQAVEFNIMDMVTVRNGQYLEHWGMNNIAAVVAMLSGKK